MNLARKHRERTLAALQGADNSAMDTACATQYELMLMQLAEHRRRLKQIQSIERKIELKRGLLPEYAAYVAGVLESDCGRQDDVLMTVLVWRIDIGDIAGALEIAAYAIRHDLQTPDRYERSTACLIAEEVADTALKLMDGDTPIQPELITLTLELTTDQDMFDQVRAKLLKAQGLCLIKAGQQAAAMDPLKRALELDERCGVKKLIETTERELRKNSNVMDEPPPPEQNSDGSDSQQTDSQEPPAS
jgi:tetratricopeptide (TPR) repeat protein